MSFVNSLLSIYLHVEMKTQLPTHFIAHSVLLLLLMLTRERKSTCLFFYHEIIIKSGFYLMIYKLGYHSKLDIF
ncbi:hypothetical protein BDF14DRAFT_1827485 [Spinellus fusiger]|nr:hypothetical protein BDF14DRAFT_1827485 [Spinellus fusiger]